MPNRFGFPDLGFGLGLRFPHYPHVIEHRPATIDWFEIIAENFVGTHSGYWEFLSDLRQSYPLIVHSVGINLGSTDPLDVPYLKKLKQMADHVGSPYVSDHLCWTGVEGIHLHDLLPVPYTEEALLHFTERVRQAQDILQRPLAIENPSSYASFTVSTMPEYEFLSRLAEDADCALVLDVNNVGVSAYNHGFSAERYIDALPIDRIVQLHLAGHKQCDGYRLDTHDRPVSEECWELYRYTRQRIGEVSSMIEWDENIPAFNVLEQELQRARTVTAMKAAA